jgi:hypothetical protein
MISMIAITALALFAAAILAFLLSQASSWRIAATALPAMLWLLLPAAIPAVLARRAATPGAARAYLAIELAAIGSTLLLWAYLLLVERDPQSAIAGFLFPVLQLPAVALLAGLVWFRNLSPPRPGKGA